LFWRLAIFSAAFRFFSISFWRLMNWFGLLRAIVLLFTDGKLIMKKAQTLFTALGHPPKPHLKVAFI